MSTGPVRPKIVSGDQPFPVPAKKSDKSTDLYQKTVSHETPSSKGLMGKILSPLRTPKTVNSEILKTLKATESVQSTGSAVNWSKLAKHDLKTTLPTIFPLEHGVDFPKPEKKDVEKLQRTDLKPFLDELKSPEFLEAWTKGRLDNPEIASMLSKVALVSHAAEILNDQYLHTDAQSHLMPLFEANPLLYLVAVNESATLQQTSSPTSKSQQSAAKVETVRDDILQSQTHIKADAQNKLLQMRNNSEYANYPDWLLLSMIPNLPPSAYDNQMTPKPSTKPQGSFYHQLARLEKFSEKHDGWTLENLKEAHDLAHHMFLNKPSDPIEAEKQHKVLTQWARRADSFFDDLPDFYISAVNHLPRMQ